jgi:hypothetical protein
VIVQERGDETTVLAVAYDVTVTTPRSERELTFVVRFVGWGIEMETGMGGQDWESTSHPRARSGYRRGEIVNRTGRYDRELNRVG